MPTICLQKSHGRPELNNLVAQLVQALASPHGKNTQSTSLLWHILHMTGAALSWLFLVSTTLQCSSYNLLSLYKIVYTTLRLYRTLSADLITHREMLHKPTTPQKMLSHKNHFMCSLIVCKAWDKEINPIIQTFP